MCEAQLSSYATHNAYATKSAWTGPDSTMPYREDQGARSVWVTKDMDKDGKPEILVTDYSNGGRVHVFEFTTPNELERVWSSPRLGATNAYSVPRWVRDGDLDGDGNREIIFPWGSRYSGKVLVFEYNGKDNGYGAVPGVADLELPAAQFTSILGPGTALRMDRESGAVADFDGDGRDELIMGNQNNGVYVIGVTGNIGSTATWVVEGGDPTVNTENKGWAIPWAHSLAADIDGDGKLEIVNHYWSYYGFWSIDPVASGKYRYPTPARDSASVPGAAKKWYYHEYGRNIGTGEDAVAYMGIQPVDVDGDKKDELAGILYTGSGSYDYSVALVSLTKQDTGVYVWKDSSQFGIISSGLWTLAGKTDGSHWGIGAYDFNGNGRQEIIVGGASGYELVALEYKGSGSILNPGNYTRTIYYPGDPAIYHNVDITDSLGKKRDTVRYESPPVSRLIAGVDINKNGKPDVVIAYYTVADSITYSHVVWDTSLTPKGWRQDSTWKIVNTATVNVRVLEWTGSTFVPLGLAAGIPEDVALEQNYPNPFNPTTTITYRVPVGTAEAQLGVSLKVFDLLGREVATLVNETQPAGMYAVQFSAQGGEAGHLASGVYLYRLTVGTITSTRKMLLLR